MTSLVPPFLKIIHKNALNLEILRSVSARMCRIKLKSTHKNVLLSMLKCDVYIGLYNFYVYDLFTKVEWPILILFYKF
jgi:hypothetical protein